MTGQLAELARLAAILKDRDLAGLAAATATCDALRAEIDALNRAGTGLSDDSGPATTAGAAARYAVWCQKRIGQLLEELAAQEAARESLHHAARVSYGRAEVLSHIAADAHATRRR